ncbi:hypothetical protein CBS147343_9879 [Aspergillus niger]|nr:hypothetical protein CBS147371_6401 [Aspergillus niger]KAI2941999.1 hypothetical protein CBS147322_9126 [Aspergillus niger]KAI2966159.1 hypothetical protein CBS147324_7591 [Aspergillus niger]KAI2984424.1 hypothetical protein CBS147344_7066 [Aspergillus niger]KAI2995828.1 hypothetical protein CBS147482_8116 [Aspergillus niger]
MSRLQLVFANYRRILVGSNAWHVLSSPVRADRWVNSHGQCPIPLLELRLSMAVITIIGFVPENMPAQRKPSYKLWHPALFSKIE